MNSAHVYLQAADGTLRKLMWFRSRRNNQLLWCPYGLFTDQPLLRAEWPEEFVDPDNSKPRLYHLRGYADRKIIIDHFNWHQDGVVLMKDSSNKPVYRHKETHLQPLGPGSPLFLQIAFQTETATEYRRIETLPADAVVIPTDVGSGVSAYVAAAGSNFPMNDYLRDTNRPTFRVGPVFHMGGFVAGLTYRSIQPDRTLIENRLRGTLVSMRFLLQSGVYRHKTFLFQ